jgi:SanA protein
MKDYAVQAGVPSSDVFMDHAGFSTYDSMYRARDIFRARKIIIVTQRYHLYRALFIARALGLDAYGVSSDYQTYAGQSYREVREIAARDKAFAFCIFKPAPSLLGDAVPISGDGDATDD